MKYLLETSFCLDLIKGGKNTVSERIQGYRPGDFFLCSIVKADLLEHARSSKCPEDNLLLLHKFCSQFKSYDFDDRAASFYGNIISHITSIESHQGFMTTLFHKQKPMLSQKDIMIASIAESNDLVLLTNNAKIFVQIPGLRIETW
ncbi:MAG: hypothetical protein ACD_62C00608G0002 [uncultured bacterium]|nr:MAG: hypothetical protein ACD_62C00608G0002 [uncultured bacterium]